MSDWEFGDTEPLFADDPVMSLLPSEIPAAFMRLSPEEQRWRGRLFIMVRTLGATESYAWSMALDDSAERCAEARAIVEGTTDDFIIESWNAEAPG